MPITRDVLEEYMSEKSQVRDVACTAHGLLVTQDPGGKGSAFGSMLRNKGWAVDYISADRETIHFIPLDGDLLGDLKEEDDA